MSDPLEPGQPIDSIPALKSPDAQQGIEQIVGGVVQATTGHISAKLADDGRVDVHTKRSVNESQLRDLQKQILDRDEARLVAQHDKAMTEQRRGADKGPVLSKEAQEHIESVKELSRVLLNDAETELARAELDIPKIRMLVYWGNSYAANLSKGIYGNLEARDALWAWQARVAKEYPEAVGQLVQSYVDSMDAEYNTEKPDQVFPKLWIALCTGFAPERTAELTEKYRVAMCKRCEYFVVVVETELAKINPDKGVIGKNIGVPIGYYKYLPPESSIPDRVKEAEKRRDAL